MTDSTPRTNALDNRFGLQKALLAVDRLLHLKIEILDAEARPRHADFGECTEASIVHIVGFDFDTDLGAGKKLETVAQDSSQRHHILGFEHRRRATAEMDGTHTALASDKTGDGSYFSVQ